MYSLENLSDFFLKNLTIKIPHGLVSLIGPNGSGKSTLLRVLSGLKDYSGSVRLDIVNELEKHDPSVSYADISPKNITPLSAYADISPCQGRRDHSSSFLPPLRRGGAERSEAEGLKIETEGLHLAEGLKYEEVKKIPRKKFATLVSFVMSNKNFTPSYPFSVREIIALSRLPHHTPFSRLTKNDTSIIERSAELLGISSLLERSIMTLSDGERQLAFIACGLAQDTKIILLDEPTSSLDPDKSAKVFAILRELADSGRDIITAVHDINTSMTYSDYYLALKNGRLISHGQNLNADVLRELYGTEFLQYHNDERNDSMWRALP